MGGAMLRRFAFCAALLFPFGPAVAQEQTLADIRAELSALYADVTGLRAELAASGQAGQGTAGATPLDRLNAIEAELTRLTAKTEELEFRILRITRDGTNRIGDLEFRLCELEPDCDIGALGDTPMLGGVDLEPETPQSAAPAPSQQGPALAVAEEADFAAAQAAYSGGDFQRAVDLLASFSENYPGSPVAADAHFLRGQAFEGLGETTNAARAYLAAFSGAPEGPLAPSALTQLGRSLGALGQTQDACLTLAEVSARFPAAEAVSDAQAAMANLGCG